MENLLPFLQLEDLISVYMSTVKWRSGSISVLCLDWRGYETWEWDLSCFGDSFGVEQNPVLPPPPVLEKLTQESSCRLELCMLLLCGSLCAQDTQCWAGCELEQPEVGRGRRAAGQAWLGCLPPISEEAHFADVLGVGQEVCWMSLPFCSAGNWHREYSLS